VTAPEVPSVSLVASCGEVTTGTPKMFLGLTAVGSPQRKDPAVDAFAFLRVLTLRGCTTNLILSIGTLTASSSAIASAMLSNVGCWPFVAEFRVCLPLMFFRPVTSGAEPEPSRRPASSFSASTRSR